MEGQVTLSSCTCSEARQCFIPHLGLAPHLPQPIKSNVSVIWAQFRSQPFSWQRGKPRERGFCPGPPACLAKHVRRGLLRERRPAQKMETPLQYNVLQPHRPRPAFTAAVRLRTRGWGFGWEGRRTPRRRLAAGREGGGPARAGPSRAPPLRLKGSQLPARPPVGARRRRE